MIQNYKTRLTDKKLLAPEVYLLRFELHEPKEIEFIPAVAPIIYNVGIIICTILFSSKIGLEAPVLGVVIGAFLFFIIQLPVIFVSDFEYRFIVERSRVLWDFFRVTMPRVFTVITAQIEATVDLSLSSLISEGSYAIRKEP
jgi:putative peptidoglycan lipid II flippase